MTFASAHPRQQLRGGMNTNDIGGYEQICAVRQVSEKTTFSGSRALKLYRKRGVNTKKGKTQLYFSYLHSLCLTMGGCDGKLSRYAKDP